MEIEIGDFVRTEKGKIFKYGKGRTYLGKNNKIVNHSKDITDLIEKDDYVNGERMDIVERDENGKVYYLQNAELPCISIKDVKSIVTKEQFKNIEYRLE